MERDRRLTVSVTEEQEKEWAEAAKKLKLRLPEFIREACNKLAKEAA